MTITNFFISFPIHSISLGSLREPHSIAACILFWAAIPVLKCNIEIFLQCGLLTIWLSHLNYVGKPALSMSLWWRNYLKKRRIEDKSVDCLFVKYTT